MAYTDPHILKAGGAGIRPHRPDPLSGKWNRPPRAAAESIQALRNFITATGATVRPPETFTEVWPPDTGTAPAIK